MTYLPDAAVDGALDAELRALLGLCFGNEFKHKRYAFEMPPHRWLFREEDRVVAHLAVHEKTFECDGTGVPFIGIAEVCVAPSHRNRGFVRAMLREAEAHFNVPFAVLLGDPKVYGSSGYRPVGNVYLFKDAAEPNPDVLVKPLGSWLWPQSAVVIEGPPF